MLDWNSILLDVFCSRIDILRANISETSAGKGKITARLRGFWFFAPEDVLKADIYGLPKMRLRPHLPRDEEV